MRIYLKVHTENQIIPFDHQSLLVGVIHKWLGWNNEHGKISLYSFSRLEGAKMVQGGLKFEKGTSFFVSSYEVDLIKKMIGRIRSDPTMFHGMEVSEIILQENPDLSNREMFYVASPILIKRRTGEKIDHIIFNDPRASNCLKETLKTKMSKVGMTDESLEIRFDKSSANAKTKMITYNGIENRANWCPVIIKGKPETKLFAWNVGLGNSTGIGFGAIK
ncbi:MAG TPA: CRISPR-associated endoribonuclease Cas6 [Bacteroidales bacterium]|nr:CRISPR-associated endoribonuclease Cas6 [Bacteroidales bacterium]HCI54317.1 CRISPR-associated endoribonuclease Cas6 [Bacteroidales bacterium]HQG36371.1 CRISPR-associated endoribonuclease Cas6 [Bacteroidales bacterium]HQG52445.1 CRISPR-associated endoribonuclease Cas6 [Bacteroidales bacterium]HQJ19996.1 CRISPR-associated endoribonuclease Cas6 [Bacteroidales bacterium]